MPLVNVIVRHGEGDGLAEPVANVAGVEGDAVCREGVVASQIGAGCNRNCDRALRVGAERDRHGYGLALIEPIFGG